MKHVLFIIALFTVCSAGAQQKLQQAKISYESICSNIVVQNTAPDSKAVFQGGLIKYFSKEISWRDFETTYGVVIADVLIDTNGVACTQNLYNYTIGPNEQVMKLYVHAIINEMPKWKPAKINGVPVASYRRLAFYSHIKGHPSFDISYIEDNRARQWEITGQPESGKVSFDWDEMTAPVEAK